MDMIINISIDIWNIFRELELLELQGKKNENDFRELIDKLNKFILLEKKLIEDMVKKYNYNYDLVMDLILNNSDIDDNVKKRLHDCIIMYKFDKGIRDKTYEYKLNKLYSSCFKNMYLLYFSNLQEFIDNEIDYNRKIGLLDLKYYDSYFNCDMESILILYNFNVPAVSYVDIDIAGQIANLSNGMDDVIAIYLDIILGFVFDILDIKDRDYCDNNGLVCLIKNQCMFRACLSLISEEHYMMISDEIKKIINSKMNDENKNSVMLVNSIINMRNKDRERVRRLSL